MGWFGRSDEDYREEIREHIAIEIQANLERGMSPDEARRAAHIAFGSVSGVRQSLHEGRRLYRFVALGEDVRYGIRTICRKRLSVLHVTEWLDSAPCDLSTTGLSSINWRRRRRSTATSSFDSTET